MSGYRRWENRGLWERFRLGMLQPRTAFRCDYCGRFTLRWRLFNATTKRRTRYSWDPSWEHHEHDCNSTDWRWRPW
jgi:hypothetical protein